MITDLDLLSTFLMLRVWKIYGRMVSDFIEVADQFPGCRSRKKNYSVPEHCRRNSFAIVKQGDLGRRIQVSFHTSMIMQQPIGHLRILNNKSGSYFPRRQGKRRATLIVDIETIVEVAKMRSLIDEVSLDVDEALLIIYRTRCRRRT